MADFGWAFVKGSIVTGSAEVSGGVQFNDGDDGFAASEDFVFISGSTSQLNLTGNLDVVGDVSASAFYGDGSNLTGVSSVPGGNNTEIQFNDNGAFAGNTNLTFDGSVLNLTGTLNVSGALNANEININVENRDVINISVTGSTKFGDSTDDTHVFTGSLDISASSNPIKVYGLQSGTPPNTSSYIALDSNYNLVLTSAAGGQTGIGEAEDGTYTDGLFSTFTSNTPIGTAIDKFNEILKILVPGPAPEVSRKNYTNTSGVGPRLSIDGTDSFATYSNVSNLGDFSDNLIKNSEFSASTSGDDFRLGVYEGSTNIVGAVNFDVVEELKSTEVNYSNNAFGNAESGSLKLEVNGTVVHTLVLNGFAGSGNPNTGSASSLNSTGSGFTNVSVSASATDQNGSAYDIFQHRTANYLVHPDDQRNGWNYSRIIHTYAGVDYDTNYVQWYNDTGGSSTMSSAGSNLEFTGLGSKFLSGIEYFRSASLVYTSEISNFYFATYPTGNVVSFVNNIRCDAPLDQTASSLGPGENYNTTLKVTASTTNNSDAILNDSISLQTRVTHHFKPTFTGAGGSVNNVLIYDNDTANNNLNQYFQIEEGFRITSGSYETQNSVIASAADWNSENHMTASGATGHEDGLAFYGGQLISPKRVANSGNPSTLANGPTGNPDYSSITGTRTFYRKIENTQAQPIRDLKITIYKNSRINNDPLSTNNVQVFVKLPGSTGFMDISQNFVFGSYSDGDGALIADADDNVRTSSTATAQSTHCVTFGDNEVSNGEHVVIKVIADGAWTGNFSRMVFQLGASDRTAPTQAPDLDFIDFNGAGGENAILSFGSSNTIGGYSEVDGASIGLDTIDFNGLFADNFNARRGALATSSSINGELNEDVSAFTPSYVANSFGNAYTGSLVLEVNGTEVHTVDLTSVPGAISNDFNTSGSGFSVSAISFSETTDDIPDYTKPYRTGTYQIGQHEQRVGWNYARVIHRIDTDIETNYVEWVIDPSGSVDNTSITEESLTDFGHTDVYYQSGIGYFAANPTASFSFKGSNFYSNVYSNATNALQIPTQTNLDVIDVSMDGSGVHATSSASGHLHAMPVLNGTSGCETTTIEVTASVRFNGNKNLGGNADSITGSISGLTSYDVGVASKIFHPLKSDITSATQTKSAFMVHSGTLGSTNLTANEYFGLETYRIVSGNYPNQAAVTSSSNTWDSSTEMDNGGSHDDGMVTIDGYLISPFKIGDAGDTRNVADGGTLQAPSGNPDYSTLSEDIRTYYRYFYNNTGTNLASITLTLYGDAELVSKEVGDTYYAALGANKNINVEVKSPTKPDDDPDQSTGWGDAARAWTSALQPTPANDGAGIRDVGGGDEQTIGSAGLGVDLTFGNRRISAGSYYVVKISAHKDWTGFISRISIS